MDIMLEKVQADKKDILFRLLQYSLYEESSNDQNDIGEDALFKYPWFEHYFVEEDREAYFIRDRKAENLLGFVMVNAYLQKNADGRSIAEFMVLPRFRRNKIGKEAAVMCFKKHRGNWEVSPAYGSSKAYLFWKNVIDEYTGGNYHYEDGIFLFSNIGRALHI